MDWFGRRVIPTKLDEIPPGLRTVPGAIAMTDAELAALERKDPATFKRLAGVAFAADKFEATRAWDRPRRRRQRIGPSARLSMVNAIYRRK